MGDASITPAQCRGARSILRWNQRTLAAKAGLSVPVVQEFECERRSPIANNLAAIRAAMEAAGIEFRREGDRLALVFGALSEAPDVKP